MVPEEFRDFFVASAGVAGALIGLLFVALSVVPKSTAPGASQSALLRPTTSMSAFLNALVVSLLALLPEIQFGQAAVVLGAVGLVAMATVLVTAVRARASLSRGQGLRVAVFTAGQAVVYVFEVVNGLRLIRAPGEPAVVSAIGVLVIVLFALGIERAWEFVGAQTPGLLGSIVGGRRPTTEE